ALAVLFAGWVPSRAEGREVRVLDAVAPWVLALDTTYNFWAGAGLESGAFALALSLSLAFAGALPAGLLAVLRPEGAVYAAPLALDDLFRQRALAVAAALALGGAAYAGAWSRSPARQKEPVLPLTYISEQGRWFRQEAQRLGLTRPRVAHFDIGGVALESGGE